LVLLARFMRDSFRLADRLFRFGGEEFALLLGRTSVSAVHDIFERFRLAVECHHFPQIGQVTVSIGYTRILPGDSPAQAFDRADAALYHAKRTGRNRCHAWDDLERSGHVKAKVYDGDIEMFV
jgi:diguanylate cyclase (GGDEF)-like protein